MQVLITHIAGSPGRYPQEVRREIAAFKPDIFVCGHSHICIVARDPSTKMIHINPGAAGKHGFHKIRTMVKFELSAGKIENMRVIELGARASV